MNERTHFTTSFMFITTNLGWLKINHFCLWICIFLITGGSQHIFRSWPLAFLILYTIYMPWPFLYCDTHLFFLLAYTCLAYILNYLSPSKYIEIFFQSVLVFYSCFWCLITSLSWSFIAFEFCVMLREPQRWKKKFSSIFFQYLYSFFTFGY